MAANYTSTGASVYQAGHVIQVVEGIRTSQSETTSTSFVDTGLSVSITPASTSNKVYIIVNMHACRASGASQGIGLRIVRDSTALFTPAATHNIWWGNSGGGYGQVSDMFLDSPSSTSSLTYKIQFASYSGASVVIQQGGSFRSSITLMEIQG